MILAEYEVPVAYSMVAMAASDRPGQSWHPMQSFTCYWAAFNNIYITIAEQHGRRATLLTNPDGSVKTRRIAQVTVPKVSVVPEREQIALAFDQFTDDLKRGLVEHPNASFFVYRVPSWRGRPIETDANGQRLNGVLNVGYTPDAAHPVWAPIDIQMFEEHDPIAPNLDAVNELTKQILDVLYTVRNNTFHAGKQADDANDREVLERALPLLEIIVRSFLSTREGA